MKKKLSKVFIILLVFASSCGPGPRLPNLSICRELQDDVGYCAPTMSGDSFYIEEAWSKKRKDMVMMPINDWVILKTTVTRLCVENEKCEIPKEN